MFKANVLACLSYLLISALGCEGQGTQKGSVADVAKDPASVVGMWSLVANDYFREVIEFRQDGTYISGLCATAGRFGWCASNEATASRQGTYDVRGKKVSVSKGIVHLGSGEVSGSQEAYRWEVQRDQSDSPRTLHLTPANGEPMDFDEMPAESRPRWISRSR
jgi:hypothetical protein